MNRHRALLTLSLIALLATPVLASWEDGVAAFRAGRYDDAASVFQAFVAASPGAPEGHYMLGMSLLRQQRPAAALAPLGEALSLSGDEIRYRMTLAQAQLKAGKPGDAFDTLAAQDPATVAGASRTGFNQLLARAAVSSRRDGEALASLDKALAVDESSKALWLARGNLAHRLDRPREAFEALSTAFKLDPSDPQPAISAVQTALVIAQSEAAPGPRRDWYVKGAGVASRLATAFPTPANLRLAGGARMGAQDYQGALELFERVLATDGEDPLLHYDLGRCRLALGQSEAALDDLAAALERSPDATLTSEIHTVRARALRRLENFADAAEAFRLAGDATAATEMAGYAQNRLDWAKARADCVRKQTTLRELVEDSQDLKHTREYQQLLDDLAAMNTACSSFVTEVG